MKDDEENIVIKRKYSYLSEVFENWYKEKLLDIQASKKLTEPPKDFLKRLNLNEDEFYNTYIFPFENLCKGDLEIVFNLLAPNLADKYTDLDIGDDCELSLIYDIKYTRQKNALVWLLFHVYLLNIFDLPQKLYDKVYEPYLQCYYCGKPDNYKSNGLIKNFNNKNKFCHKNKCHKGSNPSRHDNCCYAKWARKRKTLEKALRLAEEHFMNIENFENAYNTKIATIFVDFCEKQYRENLQINYTIQEDDNPAINLKDSFL